jgi:tetratricopeptide (TPR) repeat protein
MRIAAAGWLVLAACASGPRPEASDKYVAEGREAYKTRNWREAIRLFTRAVDENPSNAEAYLRRGNAYLRRGDRADNPANDSLLAIEDFSRALELFPMYHDAAFNRAMAQASIGRYREAVADLRSILEVTDLQLRRAIHLKIAELLYHKYEGREREALVYLEQYAALGGDDPEARALLEELKRKYPPAAASPDEEARAAEMTEQARALYAQNKKPEAMKLLAEVLRSYPQTRAAREVVPALILAWSQAPSEPPK